MRILNNNDGLLSSVKVANIERIAVFIERGADPLAIVENLDGTPTQALIYAMKCGNIETVKAVFDSALRKYQQTNVNLIDLSRKLMDQPSNINFLQLICLRRMDIALIELVINYAKATNQDIKAIINSRVTRENYTRMEGGTKTENMSFAEHLTTNLSSEAINRNFVIDHDIPLIRDFVSNSWKSWFALKKHDTNNTVLRDRVIYKGPIEVIEYLVTNCELDVGPLARLLPTMLKEQTYDELPSFISRFRSDGVMPKPKTEASVNENQLIEFPAIINNPYKTAQLECTLVIDFNELNDLVQTANVTQKNRKLDDERLEKLSKQVDNIEQRQNKLSEQRLADMRELLSRTDARALDCFNIIYNTTLDRLNARAGGLTGIYDVKPTTNSGKLADTAQSVFRTIAEATGLPGASLIAEISSAAVHGITHAHAHKQNQAAFDATLNINRTKVAIDVAIMITAVAMKKYPRSITRATANKLAHCVEQQIDVLNKWMTFEGELHLNAFLCLEALDNLSTLSPKNSHLESDSASAHSGHSRHSGNSNKTILSSSTSSSSPGGRQDLTFLYANATNATQSLGTGVNRVPTITNGSSKAKKRGARCTIC